MSSGARMTTGRGSPRAALALALGCTACLARDIVPGVIPGGGGRSVGSRFTLDGSIGQPVARGGGEGIPVEALRSGHWAQVVRWINALPVAGDDSVQRRPGEGAHILVSRLLANDRDPDFDPLTFVGFNSVSAAGGSVRREGPWLIYQPPAGFAPGAADVVTYQVTDGLGASVAGSIQVVGFVPVDTGLPNALEITSEPGPPAQVRVRFQGIAGRTYRVQQAPAVTGPWADLGTAVAASNGRLEFLDLPGPDPRFYRLVESP